jgi:hypothetical protein
LQPLRAVSTSAFRRAASEFGNCQLDLRLGVQLLDDLLCPACSGGNCAYHIDGNMKLFVWQRLRELWRAPHSQLFFAGDEDVQLTIQAVDWARVSRPRYMSRGVCMLWQFRRHGAWLCSAPPACYYLSHVLFW